MRALLIRRVPEAIGLAGSLLFGARAWLGGVSSELTFLITCLTGLGLWVTSRVASALYREGNRGRAPNLAIFGGVAVLTATDMIIRMQTHDQAQTLLVTLFFWSGVTVGLALGAYSTYFQTKSK